MCWAKTSWWVLLLLLLLLLVVGVLWIQETWRPPETSGVFQAA
jgi:hypothetical protein